MLAMRKARNFDLSLKDICSSSVLLPYANL